MANVTELHLRTNGWEKLKSGNWFKGSIIVSQHTAIDIIRAYETPLNPAKCHSCNDPVNHGDKECNYCRLERCGD